MVDGDGRDPDGQGPRVDVGEQESEGAAWRADVEQRPGFDMGEGPVAGRRSRPLRETGSRSGSTAPRGRPFASSILPCGNDRGGSRGRPTTRGSAPPPKARRRVPPPRTREALAARLPGGRPARSRRCRRPGRALPPGGSRPSPTAGVLGARKAPAPPGMRRGRAPAPGGQARCTACRLVPHDQVRCHQCPEDTGGRTGGPGRPSHSATGMRRSRRAQLLRMASRSGR